MRRKGEEMEKKMRRKEKEGGKEGERKGRGFPPRSVSNEVTNSREQGQVPRVGVLLLG